MFNEKMIQNYFNEEINLDLSFSTQLVQNVYYWYFF